MDLVLPRQFNNKYSLNDIKIKMPAFPALEIEYLAIRFANRTFGVEEVFTLHDKDVVYLNDGTFKNILPKIIILQRVWFLFALWMLLLATLLGKIKKN